MTVAASGGLHHLHRCLVSGPAEAPPSPARRPNQAKVAPPMRMIPAPAPAYTWTMILRISFSPRFYLYTQEQPEARPLPPPPTPGSGGGTCKMFCCFPTMGSK